MPVWAVLDYTNTHCIERELLLAKVSILGPEYLEQQFTGGPTHEPQRHKDGRMLSPEAIKQELEAKLAQNFERAGHPDQDALVPPPLTPTEVIHMKSNNLQAISTLSAQFGGKIVDVSEHSVIVEMCGKTKRVEAFLTLLRPFGLLESARTGECLIVRRVVSLLTWSPGLMVMPRTPFRSPDDSDIAMDAGGVVDASLLPPG